MQWHKVNGLVVPIEKPKKPTRKELMDMYYLMHCRCPSCGSNNIASTCVGYAFNDIETAKDENRAMCGCGWRGIVHDLVPQEKL
jgi:hypothetical protein